MKYTAKINILEQFNIRKDEKRASERIDATDDVELKILDEVLAFKAYLEGGYVEDISACFDLNIETLKYKIKKAKALGIKGILDSRETNGGNRCKKITKEMGQRIIELKITEPSLTLLGISKKLYEQDKTELSHTIINDYLHEIGLDGYIGSQFRSGLLPSGDNELENDKT